MRKNSIRQRGSQGEEKTKSSTPYSLGTLSDQRLKDYVTKDSPLPFSNHPFTSPFTLHSSKLNQFRIVAIDLPERSFEEPAFF